MRMGDVLIQMIGLRPEFDLCCGAGSQSLLMFHQLRNYHVMRVPSSPYHYQEGRGLLSLPAILAQAGDFSEWAPEDPEHIETRRGV